MQTHRRRYTREDAAPATLGQLPLPPRRASVGAKPVRDMLLCPSSNGVTNLDTSDRSDQIPVHDLCGLLYVRQGRSILGQLDLHSL